MADVRNAGQRFFHGLDGVCIQYILWCLDKIWLFWVWTLKENAVLKGFLTCFCKCLTSTNMVQVLFWPKPLFWGIPPTQNTLRMGCSVVRQVRLFTSLEHNFFFSISIPHGVNVVGRHTLHCITTALLCYSRKSWTRVYRETWKLTGQLEARFLH